MAKQKISRSKPAKQVNHKGSNAKKVVQKETTSTALRQMNGDVSSADLLAMQRQVGNRATQRMLQRHLDGTIQREDKEDEKADSTIVFKESEVAPIIVKNPWTSAELSADPALKSKDQGEKTVVKGGKKFAKKSDPLNYTYSFTNDTVVKTGGEGTLKYHKAKKNSNLMDVSGGMPNDWKKPFIKMSSDYEFATGVTKVRFWRSLLTPLYKFSVGPNSYLIKRARVAALNKPYVVLKLGSEEYHANKEDLYKSSAKHKKSDDPLFPDGEPLPEHVKQTGLGDCYLQAFLINVAVQNPTHLKNMIFDNGDGSVTVRFYFKNGSNWDPEFIKIKKSIATGATGKELYNQGALWAHMIEKSFTVFAGKHGMYGDALAPPSKKGYGAIEGGWTYQLGGVFYGKASKEATLKNMKFDTDSAKMLKANYAQIKKLYEFKSGAKKEYLDKKQTVMLTASASWFDTLKRIITLATSLEGSTDGTTDLGKAIKDINAKAQAAKTAAEKPENSSKGRMDIPEVVTTVKKAKDYVVGTGVIGKQALASPNNAMLNRLYELLNNFKELGSDSSPNQRFIYTHHAYSIVDVAFKDKDGKGYWPSRDDLDNKKDEVLGKIDPEKTKITIRNPHRTNTPTQNAKEESPGKFTISLDQFLTSFTRIEYGRVEKS